MKNIKTKVLIIGSGPIIIGQAAEFDYSGTQACLALKEEGYEIILMNPNPATIMTDKEIADKIYMEPLTADFCKWIIVKEKITKILPTLGGQVALNLVTQLRDLGYLKKYNVKIMGTSVESIETCESRIQFKERMKSINIPVASSLVVRDMISAKKVIKKFSFPVVLRPSFTMGGAGGGIATNYEKYINMVGEALDKSPTSECLVEESLLNYKEIEYEVIRDNNNNKMIVCNMENIDPVGVHTGDSGVVAPSLTLNNEQYQMLRTASLKIIESLDIRGGCNVQFAINPNNNDYYVIEANPRVSRSSALASKASGYPIARISAKICAGKTLDELISPITKITKAIFEPTLDYVVTKMPSFSFDKFGDKLVNHTLSTQMQATGEVMSIGTNFCESFLKSIRGLNNAKNFLWDKNFSNKKTWPNQRILNAISIPNENRYYQIYELIRRSTSLEEIHEQTGIDMFFLNRFNFIFEIEKELKLNHLNIEILKFAKKYGFSDYAIGKLWNLNEIDIYNFRKKNRIFPWYKIVDTCANEFLSITPYFYSTYVGTSNDIIPNQDKKKILILGSGPIKVGQGIEFDYSTVHAILAIRNMNYESLIINNNPETVSTDYEVSDVLFFEPIVFEDIANIVHYQNPDYLLLQFGGQIAMNLSDKLEKNLNVKILGTSSKDIHISENRKEFVNFANKYNINIPNSITTSDINEVIPLCKKLKYPVLIRPSYVIGGAAMGILYSDEDVLKYLEQNSSIFENNIILIDKYVVGKEFEIDCVSDKKNIWIPAILEHIEEAGIHSGDSTLIYPTISLTQQKKQELYQISLLISQKLNVLGLINIQYILEENTNKLFIIEVNLRSSRTIPFISKLTNKKIVDIAIKTMMGISLEKQKLIGIFPMQKNLYYIKSPVFSFHKLYDSTSSLLGPEMQSTGESWGSDITISKALYKSLLAANVDPLRHHNVVISVNKNSRSKLLKSFQALSNIGYKIYATNNTHKYLKENNIDSQIVNKIASENNIVELLKNKPISFVINIPGNSWKKKQDLAIMRKVARKKSIAIISSAALAKAICQICFDMKFVIKII